MNARAPLNGAQIHFNNTNVFNGIPREPMKEARADDKEAQLQHKQAHQGEKQAQGHSEYNWFAQPETHQNGKCIYTKGQNATAPFAPF